MLSAVGGPRQAEPGAAADGGGRVSYWDFQLAGAPPLLSGVVRRRKCGLEFVMAIAAKNVLAIQKSAQAISNACNQCHAVYRE